MLEESIPSIWASMNSWFTPTVLFVLLNLMIGTIAVTSRLGTQKQQQQTQEDKALQPRLARAPSVLERLKSFNFYRYRSEEQTPFPSITTTLQPPETETHFTTTLQPAETETHFTTTLQPPETETHFTRHTTEQTPEKETPENETPEILSQNADQGHDHLVSRTKSDTKPASGDIPMKLPQKMKKSASAKSAFGHFEEEETVEVRRPATVRDAKSKASELLGDDEEVDAKADDFINRFKHQLKLQRLDSIVRYKEMLNRGTGK
ncbi:hypothetical protein HHK36_025497 [Tetracentron sinense]|uniref:DUF4408 domain-containing protein n=1 Tax=Tetracentron sinense TaxID=13715 RepID=A0A835D5L5_TETSI|nr:hypothetical protein HHK36_025497 [Tetracentron sinense]